MWLQVMVCQRGLCDSGKCWWRAVVIGSLYVAATFVTTTTSAHPADYCLQQLADTAIALKRCEVQQSAVGECDAVRTQHRVQLGECEAAGFTAVALSDAAHWGDAQLDGDKQQSPLAQQQAQRAALERALAPFLAPLQQWQGERVALAWLDAQADTYGADGCGGGWIGRAGFWHVVPVEPMPRYEMTASGTALVARDHQLLFMQEAIPGRCYRFKQTAASPWIPNVPQGTLQLWLTTAQVPIVARHCGANDCERVINGVHEVLVEYLDAVKEFNRIGQCVEVNSRLEAKTEQGGRSTRWRGMSAASGSGQEQAPEHCPPDPQRPVKLLNAKGYWQELDQILFGQTLGSMLTN